MQPYDEFEDFGARRIWNYCNSPKSIRKSKNRKNVENNSNGTFTPLNDSVSSFGSVFAYGLEECGEKDGFMNRDHMELPTVKKISEEDKKDCEQFEKLRRLADEIAQNRRIRESISPECFLSSKRSFDDRASGSCMSELRNNQSGIDVSSAFRLDGPPSAQTTIGGKAYDYFGGDGFLGLQADPGMIQAACTAAVNYGLATATSRSCFTAAPVQEVERNAARFLKAENAYYTLDELTLGELLLSFLSNSFERAFVDEASAAFWKSCFERLNGRLTTKRMSITAAYKELVVFKHCDVVDLQEKLEQELELGERPILLTSGVFADFGSIAPLRDYERVLKRFGDAIMLVDDSHGIGVLGDNGRGTLEYWGYDFAKVNQTGREVSFDTVSADHDDFFTSDSASRDLDCLRQNGTTIDASQVSVYMFASLAKAVGGFGCVAAGSDLFVERLVELNDAFYAVPPNAIAAATAYALKILEKSNARLLRLKENVKRLREGLREIGVAVDNIPTPIIAIQIGSIQNMRRIREELERERFLTSFLPVSYNGTRGLIRIAVFATHTSDTIDSFLTTLKRILAPKNV